MFRFAVLILLTPWAAMLSAQLAASAPADKPLSIQAKQMAAIEAAIAPYIAQAKETYPAAKERVVKGLAPGETFFVATRLRDSKGHFEQVFIRVSEIRDGTITGRIASDVSLVEGFARGQSYTFPESELIDWLIAKPDGSEEGNVVGKFLDTYQP